MLTAPRIHQKQGKEESARIRVENIIRSDINTELLEVLELYCELLLARTGLMESKDCDPGLEEAVKSIIYAAPRTEVKELQQVRQLLIEKYGKDFALEAIDNSDGKVAERVLSKLKVTPPQPELVTLYLKEIARTYGIDWPREQTPRHSRDDDDEDEDDEGSGGQKICSQELEPPLPSTPATAQTSSSNEPRPDRSTTTINNNRKDEELSRATPPRRISSPRSPVVSVAAPSPRSDNVNPKIKLPLPPDLRAAVAKLAETSAGNKKIDDNLGHGGGSGTGKGGKEDKGGNQAKEKEKDKGRVEGRVEGKIPDVDELAKRFAALKKNR